MKSTVQKACINFLRPFISLLLHHKITWPEFTELTKKVYVEAAANKFGLDGRETNTSKISLLTGIYRKEVSKIRKEPITEDRIHDNPGQVSGNILSHWWSDSDYTDEYQNPLILDITGPKPSFESLVKKYGRDVTRTVVMKELIEGRTVRLMEDQKIMTTQRQFFAAATLDEKMSYFFGTLRDISENMLHNTENPDDRIKQGEATEIGIPEHLIIPFNKFIQKKSVRFLADIDDWLITNQAYTEETSLETIEAKQNSETFYRAGAGVYAIINNEKGNPYEDNPLYTKLPDPTPTIETPSRKKATTIKKPKKKRATKKTANK